MVLHRSAALTEMHRAHNWEYDDAAARTSATGFISANLNKLALQLDDSSMWILKTTAPEWVEVGASVGSLDGYALVAIEDQRWVDSSEQRQELRDSSDGYQKRLHTVNGAVLETVDIDVTSDGATITFAIQAEGGGDLTVFNDDGISYIVDTTPAGTVSLTAGSDTSPTLNYVYFLSSTMSITVSTVGWPDAACSPLATVVVQSATGVQSDGVYKMHAWTDHVRDSNGNGHIGHIGAWIRSQNATWLSGAAPTATGGAATFDMATTSATVLQMHSHAYPAFDTATGSDIFIVNDFSVAYKKVGDLVGELTDSQNVTMSNKAFWMTFWGVVSEKSTDSKLMCNLPNGSYNSLLGAADDLDGTSVFTIPAVFVGTGFLIARVLVKHNSGAGTWVIDTTEDLRGQFPSSVAGSTLTATTSFPDNQFEITNVNDDTKIINFDASAISTGTTRTVTVPNRDLTLISAGQGADGYLAFFTGPDAIAGDNDLFFDRANNRLGIGNSAPAFKLDVTGEIAVPLNNRMYFGASVSDGWIYAQSGLLILGAGGTSAVISLNVDRLQIPNGRRLDLTGTGRIRNGNGPIMLGNVVTTSHGLLTGTMLCSSDTNGNSAEFDGKVFVDGQLEITTTTGSLLLPRMTTSEKDNITGTTAGMMVYDSDLDQIDGYVAGAWTDMTQNFQPFQTAHVPAGTTQTIDWANGRNHIIDLDSASGTVTLTLNNPIAGTKYIIKTIQGATARDITYPAAVLWPGGVKPIVSVADDSIDVVELLYDGTNYFGSFEQAFS